MISFSWVTSLLFSDSSALPLIWYFIDITMPVMNGFDATRAIREIERNRGISCDTEGFAPALIVALTGLASGRDQAEASACGMDMYLTKPVSFKEVGRLLNNWDTNRAGKIEGV